ncbi:MULTISPECIES: hypothetical protein [Devosia]|jgi:hypothetical protein|uniref:Uncharacterized protein n=1 Tax=Devosia litorisediminis TaxID=2829817 RepID=A0A942E8Z0_9HYPH|nr:MULTISPECIES: hypothetical protein [Devosia]MBS3847737.1 hypothetical protein [Devosia litorisediminis]MCZ4345713.1 hypothetical protein [Devosia neptuniae]|tara:strand:- start:255 stop:629 length:375 start_codon:yes stop_codon:yes gene_type:complete
MPRISEYFFRAAIVFLIAGIALGLHMSISGNHAVAGAHAHINLLGWVTSALFGGYFALNPAKAVGRLPVIQFFIYTAGVIVMGISLYLLLSGNPAVEPIVAASSMVTFLGVLIFAWIVWMPARH